MMPITPDCPICGVPATRSLPARIAHFFRVRCRIPPDRGIVSWLCSHCPHVFFDPQPSDEQLRRYYRHGYNDWFFAQERLAFEPAWAVAKEMAENPDSGHNNERRRFYRDVFPDGDCFTGSVVDFGGNDGEWTARIFPNARSITVVDLDFGGDRPGILADCDLFFAAHVLEHVALPYATLMPLVKELRQGARVWVEVPQQYDGDLAARMEELGQADDGLSPLTNMHEHIQHFSTGSIRALFNRCGLRTVCEIFDARTHFIGAIGERS